MTRLEQIRRRIETDEGLIDILVEYSDFIECCRRGWTDNCATCKYGGRTEEGDYDCYGFEPEEGFECPNKSVREQLVEYLKEDIYTKEGT